MLEMTIVVISRLGVRRELAWPVTVETDKAVRILTPGGAVWVPRNSSMRRTVSLESRPLVLQSLSELLYSNARIRIFSPQLPSATGGVRATIETSIRQFDRHVTKRRQIWLQSSHVETEGREHFAPLWAVRRAFENARQYLSTQRRSLRVGSDESILGIVPWPGMTAIETQIRKAFRDLEVEDETARDAARARAAVNLAEQQAKMERDAKWRTAAAAKASEAAARAVQRSAARKPDRIIAKATVRWIERQWSSTKNIKTDHSSAGCSVRVFGKKHEITLPSGRVLVKMEGPNLTIAEEE